MTEQNMKDIVSKLPEAAKQDAHYILYAQATAAEDAIIEDINNGSPTARTDTVDIVIGDKRYSVGCWSAEAVGAVNEMLHAIKEYAVEELQSFIN